VKVGEARAVAARWVDEHAARIPGFAGAFLSGSATWLPDSAELPSASDVDVTVLTDGAAPPPKLGKFRWSGVLLEVTYRTWAELPSAEAILSSYHLAGSFRTDTVLADPAGRLAALRSATTGEYARMPWVRRRCDDAEARILAGLARLDPRRPLHERLMGWVFPTGVTTHVLLTAGLCNPTVRRRYAAARDLLAEYGRAEAYEELLGLLGCVGWPRDRVEHHLRAMTAVFDATVPHVRTPVPFAADLTPAARPVAVDGGWELVGQGLHREAVFWIVVTYTRCLTVLAADAPQAVTAWTPGLAELAADLGVATSDDLARRAGRLRDHLPRLRDVAEAILGANPGVEP
jgi:hypothetical protein